MAVGRHSTGARPLKPKRLRLGAVTSPTRGCGKTHIATGLALAARETGRSAAFVEEKRLLAAYWGASLEAQERLLIRYGERIWLLVIDDLGRRPVRRQHEDETTSVADVWDALLNRRYARGYLPGDLHLGTTLAGPFGARRSI
jgi:DNA replication protein DnaC